MPSESTIVQRFNDLNTYLSCHIFTPRKFYVHISISDAYDALVMSGGMGEGHIPTSACTEMIRVVKPGELRTTVNYRKKSCPEIVQLRCIPLNVICVGISRD